MVPPGSEISQVEPIDWKTAEYYPMCIAQPEFLTCFIQSSSKTASLYSFSPSHNKGVQEWVGRIYFMALPDKHDPEFEWQFSDYFHIRYLRWQDNNTSGQSRRRKSPLLETVREMFQSSPRSERGLEKKGSIALFPVKGDVDLKLKNKTKTQRRAAPQTNQVLDITRGI